MRLLPFPNHHRAVLSARALIANPNHAALVPLADRTTAWHIAGAEFSSRLRNIAKARAEA